MPDENEINDTLSTEPIDKLIGKTQKNFNDFKADVLKGDNNSIFDNSYRITAFKEALRFIKESADILESGDIEYMLQYEYPLEILASEWNSRMVYETDEMYNAFESICEKRDLDVDYQLVNETKEKTDYNAPAAELQDKILDRVEENFYDFRADTLAKGEIAVFDMAYKISMYEDVVGFFEYRAYNLKPEDIEYLLQYQNPLEIIVDELCENGKDDLNELDNLITDFCKRRDIGNKYPLINEKEAKTEEKCECEKSSLLGRVQDNKCKLKSNKASQIKKRDIEIE